MVEKGLDMTIELLSGTPGTGKSLDAAGMIRFRLNHFRDRPILANFDINRRVVKHPEAFHYYPNEVLSPKMLAKWARDYWGDLRRSKEDYIWLVLDEVQLLFNSREWNKKGNGRQDWLTFFSQHRHYGYRIVFIAQAAEMIDNQFRKLIEYEVVHRKMSTAGTVGWLLSLPFRGRLFVRVRVFYQMRERLGAEFYVARRKDMELYDTTALFSGMDAPADTPEKSGGVSHGLVST